MAAAFLAASNEIPSQEKITEAVGVFRERALTSIRLPDAWKSSFPLRREGSAILRGACFAV